MLELSLTRSIPDNVAQHAERHGFDRGHQLSAPRFRHMDRITMPH
jgi:hypothetical protein